MLDYFLNKARRYAYVSAAVMIAAGCAATGNRSEEAQEYDLLTLETENHTVQTEYSAQIKGRQDIRIIPRVDGYLEQILVTEGENVKKGQLLFVIDQVSYRAAVKNANAGVLQAKALRAKAQNDLESKKNLFSKKVISEFDLIQTQRDLDVAEANLVAANAALETAKNNLSFTELKSPSDGVVGRIPYRKGDYVGPTTEDGLTVVSDNSRMYVYFSLSEIRVMEYLTEYGSMRAAIDSMPDLSILLPGGREYAHKGRVETVSGIVDGQTGAVSVRAVFPNDDGILLSGGTARVVMPHSMQNVIIIPQEATFEVQDKIYVYKVEDGKAVSTIITVERLNDGKQFIVTGGLQTGDVIIAAGAGLVREGTMVKKRN